MATLKEINKLPEFTKLILILIQAVHLDHEQNIECILATHMFTPVYKC